MSHLALTLTTAPKIDIDATSITAALQNCQADELLRTELLDTLGKPAGVLGDYFSVTPTAAPEHRIEGDLSEFHRLAAGWTNTTLTVVGTVGSHFASGMRSGSITLRGSAGDHCASQLRGGRLNAEGDVGNYVGGPNPGIRSGMSGGEVVIQGHAGIHAGYRMRRGMLIVLGDCDEGVGSEMVAGTLIVAGRCGSLVGIGMRRGTIVCADAQLEPSGLRFTAPREQQLTFARLLAEHLQVTAPEISSRLSAGRVRRSLGDRTVGGQGELWLL